LDRIMSRVRAGVVIQAGFFAAAAVALAAVQGCEEACPTIGCQDRFTATASGADGTLPAGSHRVDVTADGQAFTCTFTFPIDAMNGLQLASCTPGVQLQIRADQTCTETTTGNAQRIQCTPIPGRFSEELTLLGRPEQIHVEQSVGGALLLDETATPAYAPVSPGGPGCGPVCRQAAVTWSLATPAAQ